MISVPIAFLIFRRPDLTARVFEAIRQAQPRLLFIVADGARNESEQLLCRQARAVTEVIDWDCEVFRNYADENLGCRKRVSSGLDWVFAQVEEAIILEDDCLPHPSFFPYCQELLDYYRDDQRIWCISGDNFQDGQWRGDGSYYFSNYNHCWGWASWRRAWQKYDHDLTSWQKFRGGQYLRGILDSELEVKYWQSIFEQLYKTGKPNTWDCAWTFTCWKNRGLTILPNVNLISNIGFRSDGTHTLGESKLGRLPVQDIGDIRHPSFLLRDRLADEYTFDYAYGAKGMREETTLWGRLQSCLSTMKSRAIRLLTNPLGLLFSASQKIKVIRKSTNGLRKIANRLDKPLAMDALNTNIKSHSSSRISESRIILKSNCSVHIDENTQVDGSIFFDKEDSSVSIGKRSFVGGAIICAENVEIGDDVMIAWGATIVDHNSHAIPFSKRSEDVTNWMQGKKDWTDVKVCPVRICNKVWIGFNSIILKGVTIGEGSIVGAGSVVTKDVPPWTIVAGNPARIIREIPEEER